MQNLLSVENQLSFIPFIQPMFIDDWHVTLTSRNKKKVEDTVCLNEVKGNLRWESTARQEGQAQVPWFDLVIGNLVKDGVDRLEKKRWKFFFGD